MGGKTNELESAAAVLDDDCRDVVGRNGRQQDAVRDFTEGLGQQLLGFDPVVVIGGGDWLRRGGNPPLLTGANTTCNAHDF